VHSATGNGCIVGQCALCRGCGGDVATLSCPWFEALEQDTVERIKERGAILLGSIEHIEFIPNTACIEINENGYPAISTGEAALDRMQPIRMGHRAGLAGGGPVGGEGEHAAGPCGAVEGDGAGAGAEERRRGGLAGEGGHGGDGGPLGVRPQRRRLQVRQCAAQPWEWSESFGGYSFPYLGGAASLGRRGEGGLDRVKGSWCNRCLLAGPEKAGLHLLQLPYPDQAPGQDGLQLPGGLGGRGLGARPESLGPVAGVYLQVGRRRGGRQRGPRLPGEGSGCPLWLHLSCWWPVAGVTLSLGT
jgi:hypothetical protein